MAGVESQSGDQELMSLVRPKYGLRDNVWIRDLCLGAGMIMVECQGLDHRNMSFLRATDRLRVSIWIRVVVVCLWLCFFYCRLIITYYV